MPDDGAIQPSRNATCLPFEAGGVLHYAGSQRLWVLNHTLAYIWHALADLHTLNAVSRDLADTFGIDAATANADARNALAYFRKQGLLEGTLPRDTHDPEYGAYLHATGQTLEQAWQPRHRHRIILTGRSIQCDLGDARQAEDFQRLFGHLEDTCPPVKADLSLAVTTAGQRFNVYFNGRLHQGNVTSNEVMPMLVSAIFMAAAKSLTDKTVLHAAVLVKNARAILLPAFSGKGKSTLALLLTAHGWEFFSDELALIDSHTLQVHPFPFPFTIKTGTFDTLKQCFPHLAESPTYTREDGKQVKYFNPDSEKKRGEPAPIEAILFPGYERHANGSLTEIDNTSALKSLAETAFCDRDLSLGDAKTLIRLACNTRTYVEQYNSSEQALEQVNRVFIDAPLAPRG